jgi:Niemann-Pick C1 protein
VRRYYAPFLLKPIVKAGVLIIFTGAFVASVISMQHLELGLGTLFDSSVDFMLICVC